MAKETLRNILLQVIQESSASDSSVPMTTVLDEVRRRAQIRSIQEQQLLLTLWYDLFRNGHLSWGVDITNAEPPHCHLTEQGRKMLEHVSRDPANPEGYMAYLRNRAVLNKIAESYITEALNTYNSSCYKATAVMVGGAAESLVLHLRDTIMAKMQSLGHSIPSDLKDWRIKRILDSIETVIQQRKASLPRSLLESFEAYYSAFTGQIRFVRNDAGHPKSVDPVSQDIVHASLLIFPELAKLVHELESWVSTGFA